MVNIIQKAYRFGNNLWSHILCPEECLRCGKECFGMPLCKDCRSALELEALYSASDRCKKCGKILLSEQNLCMSCTNENILKDCDSVFPLCSYRLWKKNLVFEWKINDRRILTEFFAEMVYKKLYSLYGNGEIPAIVPVPPHKGKIRRRGWDQIEDLSYCLKRTYGLTILTLLNNYSSQQQKKKNFRSRLSRTNAFRISCTFDRIQKTFGIPKEVILIDDVITTGATVNACSRTLKNAGIAKVNVLSLFIVD